ncbi:hypothetical protein BJF78_06965 [Pseudonocardia sp. CNS-139]|nr:hypothetical protein BJF78_06965 [Pseudonocardia sp. CNS-139]
MFSGGTAQADFFEVLGRRSVGMTFWFDNKLWTQSDDSDVALFNSVMQRLAPTTRIDNNVVTTFSTLMTLKQIGDRVGGDRFVRGELARTLSEAGRYKQFMGPEVDTSVHLPGFPTAFHTGAFLYSWNGTGFDAAGTGYYSVNPA